MFQRELKTWFFLLRAQLTLCLLNVFLIGNDEQEFALALFEDEDKYSVVETSRIQEKYYVVNHADSTCFMGNGEISYTFPCKADFMW